MNIVYFLAPLALLLSLGFVAAFIWATATGQWDDLDLTPLKMLDETPTTEERKHESID